MYAGRNFRQSDPKQNLEELWESYGKEGAVFATAHWHAALGDLDEDGDQDVMTLDGFVWLNDGNGVFDYLDSPIGDKDFSRRSCFALGDFDGDDDLDALVVSSSSKSSRLWFNDGSGGFAAFARFPAASGYLNVSLSIGDIDADGDLDACIKDRLYRNDGMGNFSDSGSIAGLDSKRRAVSKFLSEMTSGLTTGNGQNRVQIILGDIDNDGDLDGLMLRGPAPYEAWLNNGQGDFHGVDLWGENDVLGDRSAALGDLDGDGAVDLWFASEQNEVWLNKFSVIHD